jgi:hypothetical protein
MTIQEVYAEFNGRLESLGKIVIAGGAVRDTLMGKTPKDWDVFILQGVEFDFNKAKDEVAKKVADLSPIPPVVTWHKSEPYLCATIKWNDAEIQILSNPSETVLDLLASFDWNVCLFAFDGEYHCGELIENIGVGKSLRLNKLTFPISTLRRGFRFSERFMMKFERDEIVTICKAIIEKDKVGNQVGPQGNEPDMASLAANSLVDDKV